MEQSLALPAAGSSPGGAAAAPGRGPWSVDPVGPIGPLSPPDIDAAWRYARAYVPAVWAGLFGPHRFSAGASAGYGAPVRISPRLGRRWRALFDVPARAAPAVPLMAHQSVGARLYARLFADLGVNLRHLQHQQHRSLHAAGVAACAMASEQQLSCAVSRVLRLGEDRVLVELRSELRDGQGLLMSVVEDGFVVSRLPPDQLGGLPSDRALLRELLGLHRRAPRMFTHDAGTRVAEMPVPRHMGVAYGRLSGDIGASHTTSLGAWLFGLQRPFLQGLALRDLVVRHLAELGSPLYQLGLTFVAPAYLGQTLQLLVQDDGFEVQDADGRLVAFGQGRPPEPLRAVAAAGSPAVRPLPPGPGG